MILQRAKDWSQDPVTTRSSPTNAVAGIFYKWWAKLPKIDGWWVDEEAFQSLAEPSRPVLNIIFRDGWYLTVLTESKWAGIYAYFTRVLFLNSYQAIFPLSVPQYNLPGICLKSTAIDSHLESWTFSVTSWEEIWLKFFAS